MHIDAFDHKMIKKL